MNMQQIVTEGQRFAEKHIGDKGSFFSGFVRGATWANEQNAAEIARLRAAVNDLCIALRDLHDEQNDAPLERRRHQWEAAMENAIETLKLYERIFK